MQKRKRWQHFLTIAVIILTIYNILPTIFYYAQPLNKPVNEPKAKKIAHSIAQRVNELEKQSIQWIHSFCNLLQVKPASVQIDPKNPKHIIVQFTKKDSADKFKTYLPRAGSLIHFAPAQLSVSSGQNFEADPKKIIVQREIPIEFNKQSLDRFFSFSEKQADSKLSDLYQEVLADRAAKISYSLAGPSDQFYLIAGILEKPINAGTEDMIFALAHEIVNFTHVFGENGTIGKRYFSNLLQGKEKDLNTTYQKLIQSFDSTRDKIKLEKKAVLDDPKAIDKGDRIKIFEKQESLLIQAETTLKKNKDKIINPFTALSFSNIYADMKNRFSEPKDLYEISFNEKNPFISSLSIDISNSKIYLNLHKDILNFKEKIQNDTQAFEQIIFNEIARISRLSDEKILSSQNEFIISLNTLPNSKSILSIHLPEIAKEQILQIKTILEKDWNPTHPEFQKERFFLSDYANYEKLPAEDKALGIIIYSPSLHSQIAPKGFKESSLYIIPKGINRIYQKYQKNPDSKEAKAFFNDFKQLEKILKQNGYMGYMGSILPGNSPFSQDYIFEKADHYQTLMMATRENFSVHGSKRFGVLEFTDLEQRILTKNRIESAVHEDLLKWRDDYRSAQDSLNPQVKYDFPKPTKNVLWNNFLLSVKKYFRGDERKILHWGLDLSGGKTVQIELRDQNNHVVKNEADLKQGIDELYKRVNKMGVSEVNIRLVDHFIVLDFPGSQNMSAAELVKASSMYFHIVNEKFTPANKALAPSVNRFLQEVWNEAVVTNKKDVKSINEIAWKHLYGETLDSDVAMPRTEAAKELYENGLRIASPLEEKSSSNFNDQLSKIAIFRGNDTYDWNGQAHPLLIVFNNYALEGANLQNVHASYDASKGNFLSFEIRSAATTADGEKYSPKNELYNWTSQFSKEKIAGTPLETITQSRGWRMAVILNESIISAPNLEAALKDSAMITGSFSQREINQLTADLKAGSLTYTPHILSEKNVSPELGKSERTKGIIAMIISLLLIILAMLTYYRFSGIIASCAVLLNLLIMWAALQNIQATLSLASIAGVILTIGMAVDANVLVFERIREEFGFSGRLSIALQAGYKKTYSAIIDSNVTTIIAALILLHFDSGPIKGFALTLIIGIISSMFTALFLTKYFFTGWLQKTKAKSLNMLNIIKTTSFDFLKKAKYAMIISSCIILAGGALLFYQGKSILGMDFTGGFSLTLELNELPEKNYRERIEKAFIQKGATPQDFQIRELNPSNNIRLLFGTSMEAKGKPFHLLPIEKEREVLGYSYQSNPRIEWIVNSLEKSGLSVKEKSLETLDANWTSMSGQMSDSMRNNALIGLSLAFLAILIYLTFRFEFKFAISALCCLFHDVFISIGTISILYFLKIPVQIDLNTIAALMTIIGYSLNDTIIIFDRIREDSKILRKKSFKEIINHSLNVTLSRTTMTSLTTLLGLLALVILGGSTVFNFALVMMIGVIFGTFSSLFIASPLMLIFHRIEAKKQKTVTKEDSV